MIKNQHPSEKHDITPIVLFLAWHFQNSLRYWSPHRYVYAWGTHDDVIKWKYFPALLASEAELWCFLWSVPVPTVEQTMETTVIRETQSRSLWRHCNVSKYSTHVTCHYHESRWQSHKIIRKVQASGLCFQCSGWQCKSQALKATNPIYTMAFPPGSALLLRKCPTPSH